MTIQSKLQRADRLEAKAAKLRQDARALQQADLAAKPLLDRMVFAAHSRCECGAGFAYDPTSEDKDSPFKGPSKWPMQRHHSV